MALPDFDGLPIFDAPLDEERGGFCEIKEYLARAIIPALSGELPKT